MALTTWAAYQANNPEKAQQLTQVLLCIKGTGVNENYVLEADPATGGLPIVISQAPIEFTLNGADQAVTQDTTTPSNDRPLPVKSIGRTKANAPVRNNYVSTPVTTAAYVQLVAATTATAQKLQIFDSSGETLYLATGAAGAEVDQLMITPGGLEIEYAIAAGSRISIKAISANASVGEIVINFLT
jgi:hypothetical protein